MKSLIKLILITLMLQTFTFAKSSSQCDSKYESINNNIKKFIKYGKQKKMDIACKFFHKANESYSILFMYKCNTTVEFENQMLKFSSLCPKSK